MVGSAVAASGMANSGNAKAASIVSSNSNRRAAHRLPRGVAGGENK